MDSFEVNKIAGGVLGTLLATMGLGLVATWFYEPTTPAKPGYELPLAAAETSGTGDSKTAAPAKPLPVLLAFERGTEAERGFWRRVLETREQGPDDLAEAQRLIVRHRALHDTVERARLYGDQALAALQAFPDGPERRALAGIVEFCIARAR